MKLTNKILPRCFTICLAAAALLLAICGAPALARGGGGGGGHGFGGGFGHSYGGGFGGSRRYGGGFGGFGSRSYYYHPYYHPYYYHAAYYGSYRYGYGGYGYGGYGGGGSAVFFWIVGIVAAIYVLSWIARAAASRRNLVVITLVLEQGEQYTQSFARFTRTARLDTPAMRNAAAHVLLDRVADHDILASYVHTLQTGGSDQLGALAKQIWQTEMDRADVHPDVVNVASPEGKMSAQFGEATAIAGQAPEGCCLFSLIAVASGTGFGASADRSAAIAALQHLHSATIDSFYFYFTPAAGQAMPRSEAIDVLQKIAAAA